MHCATLVYPCDNKRLLGGLESILELFPVASDNATSTAQRHSATSCHHRPPAHRSPQATAGHCALGTHQGTAPAPTMPVYIYSTGLSIEKSINWSKAQTVLKCSTKIISYSNKYRIIYYFSIVYLTILYYAIVYRNNMIVLINMSYPRAREEDPPSPKNLDPLFYGANVVNLPQTKWSKKSHRFQWQRFFRQLHVIYRKAVC